MNIFALHPHPRKAARWHVDKHVIKMILETCQLLYTAHWVLAYPCLTEYASAIAVSRFQKTLAVPPSMLGDTGAPRNKSGAYYRPCHIHHPCAKWTRRTLGNYRWLGQLALELAREFRYRFGHEHSCEQHAIWLASHPPPTIRKFPRTQFVMAMDNTYKISNNPIVSYRHFYNTSKRSRGLISYTGRHCPHWLCCNILEKIEAHRDT